MASKVISVLLVIIRPIDNVSPFSMKDLFSRSGDRCNIIVYAPRRTDLAEADGWPRLAISDPGQLSADYMKSLKRRSTRPCTNIFGHMSDVGNLTAFQLVFRELDRVTMYLLGDAEESLPGAVQISRPTVFMSKSSTDNWSLHLHCPFKGDLGLVNLWKPGSGFLNPFSSTQCINYLSDQHIIVSGPDGGPRPFAVYNENGGRRQAVNGVDVEIVRLLAAALNFTFHVRNDGAWTVAYPDGGWGGVVGSVRNRTAAFGIAPFFFSEFNYRAVDNLHYLYDQGAIVICTPPLPVVPITNLVEPFQGVVWIVVICTILAVVICYVAASQSPFSESSGISISSTVGNCIMEALMTSFSQNHIYYRARNPVSKSIMVGFWFSGDFFIKSFYGTLLLAYLLTSKYEKPADTLEDVYEQGRPLYIAAGTQQLSFLSLSPNPINQALLRQVVENHRFAVPVDGAFPIKEEWALIQNRGCHFNTRMQNLGTTPKYIRRYGFNPFRVPPVTTIPFVGGWVAPKHAVYNEEINHVLMHLPDSGLINYYYLKYIPAKFLFPAKEPPPPPSRLTPLHFLGAFIVLASLLVLTTLVFLGELLKSNGSRTALCQTRRHRYY